MWIAKSQPQSALASARAWAARGGGAPARHCWAVALIGLGKQAEAARRLEDLVNDRSDPRIERLRVDLLGQAGSAWMISGHAERAKALFDRALKLQPKDIDLLIDRSLAHAAMRRYRDATEDLTRAVRLAPYRADLFVLRATALRRRNRLDSAEQDIERSLALDPAAPEALLEKGIIRRLMGDPTGARKAWTRLVETAPASASADIARKHLTRLKAKTE